MLRLCEEISARVREEIENLINTEEGKEFVKINGKITQRIDAIAEKACFEVIEESKIPMLVISEESGVKKFGEGKPKYICLLDPLDGSFNALHNIPFFAISIAFARDNEIIFGYVKNLVNKDYFYAEKGKEVKFNNKTIKIKSEKKSLKKSVISFYPPKRNIKVFELLNNVLTFRTLGSAALELCYVALEKLDAFIDLRDSIRNIDVAAASLIVSEAGGVITDKKGEELKLSLKEIQSLSVVASTPKLHEKIMEYIK